MNSTDGIVQSDLPAIDPETTAPGFTATFSGHHDNSSTKWYTGSGYQSSATGLYNTGWSTSAPTSGSINDYYEIDASNLANYSDITLSYAQTGSNTGPADFKVQYTTDGTNTTALDPLKILCAGSR